MLSILRCTKKFHRSNAGRRMGNPPVGTRWVDVINNSHDETIIRSRVVARSFAENGDKRENLFTATPPLDTLKSLLALSFREGLKVMAIGVKKARLSGVMTPGTGTIVCRTRRCGGSRASAVVRRSGPTGCALREERGRRIVRRSWRHWTRGAGTLPRRASEGSRKTRALVHCGDFFVARPKRGLDRVKHTMKEWYEVRAWATLVREAGQDTYIGSTAASDRCASPAAAPAAAGRDGFAAIAWSREPWDIDPAVMATLVALPGGGGDGPRWARRQGRNCTRNTLDNEDACQKTLRGRRSPSHFVKTSVVLRKVRIGKSLWVMALAFVASSPTAETHHHCERGRAVSG